MEIETYYTFACLSKGRRKIVLDYPTDALPMIAEYLNDAYEVYGIIENESADETDEDRWQRVPLKFKHKDYDNQKGYVVLLDNWGETVKKIAVVCEEYEINWSLVKWWAEELFEFYLLPFFNDNSAYFEWTWRHGPGLAARVWSKKSLLQAYNSHANRFGGIWNRRYAKLLATKLKEG